MILDVRDVSCILVILQIYSRENMKLIRDINDTLIKKKM